jgi:hypothetical protein
MTHTPTPGRESPPRWIGQRPAAGAPQRAFDPLRDEQAAPGGTGARRISGTDPHGYVTATVDLDGRLTGLTINPHAMYDLSAGELGNACTAAANAAWARRTDAAPHQAGPQ